MESRKVEAVIAYFKRICLALLLFIGFISGETLPEKVAISDGKQIFVTDVQLGFPHILSLSLGLITDFDGPNSPSEFLRFKTWRGLYTYVEPSIVSVSAGFGYGQSSVMTSLKVYGSYEHCYIPLSFMKKNHSYVGINLAGSFLLVTLKTGVIFNTSDHSRHFKVSMGIGW